MQLPGPGLGDQVGLSGSSESRPGVEGRTEGLSFGVVAGDNVLFSPASGAGDGELFVVDSGPEVADGLSRDGSAVDGRPSIGLEPSMAPVRILAILQDCQL